MKSQILSMQTPCQAVKVFEHERIGTVGGRFVRFYCQNILSVWQPWFVNA